MSGRNSLSGRCFENRFDPDFFLPIGDLEAATENFSSRIISNYRPSDDSVYLGGPGIGYAFARVGKDGKQFAQGWREKSHHQLRRDPDLARSLLCGHSGVLFAEMACGINDHTTEILSISPVCDSDEWLYGKVGLLHALLILKVSGYIIPNQHIQAFCLSILESGKKYDKRRLGENPPPLMYQWYNDEFLGAAHGLSGIIYQLLLAVQVVGLNEALGNSENLQCIKLSVDWLINVSRVGGESEGNYAACLGDRDAFCIHFCHGATGLVFMLCKAYEIFPEQRYKDLALEAGELVWKYGLLKKGPGLCHGVAGNGYAFLTILRTFYPDSIDNIWLKRAHLFASFILSHEKKMRTPDRPLSLFEGIAGTMCFFKDLQNPMQAAFPLFELKPFPKK